MLNATPLTGAGKRVTRGSCALVTPCWGRWRDALVLCAALPPLIQHDQADLFLGYTSTLDMLSRRSSIASSRHSPEMKLPHEQGPDATLVTERGEKRPRPASTIIGKGISVDVSAVLRQCIHYPWTRRSAKELVLLRWLHVIAQ